MADDAGWMLVVFQTEYHTKSEGIPEAAGDDDDATEYPADEVE
ncbi:hypothetical protein RU820_00455 [Acidithiobacillus ferrooxidans]|nr:MULTISPECIES: hypothetical protein [Acidithiobacillus]MCR0969749.1 hypothetical protein [Acidithiobacillus ferrooxidans]MCR1342138.1 hypothetical protein [Acidithiobacillus ferrooxidans]MCR1344671.1 hypothetical protein [Acidithiobacillus ferrooxidans]MCR1348836.1 hypothetical protein [Acidithiobacillus ferrooxidans]MCR1351686.1 hypothetical protein [Acidithiobacillus ferrooxidans]